MSLPRRDAARTRLGVAALTAVLLLAAGIAPALARSANSPRAADLRDWWHRAVRTLAHRGDARLDALPGDTAVVYGPLRVTSPSGSQTMGVERFTASVLPGRQYLLEIERGDASGNALPATLAVRLNGSAIAAESDFAGGVTRVRRVVALTSVDTVTLAVSGSAGATAQVKVLEIADPTVMVFGPQEFLRGTGQPETEIVHFTFDGRGGAPYRMCIMNGLADGTKRTSSATVVLNGQTIVTQSDVNQQVGSLTRTAPLVVGDNVMEVRVASIPTSRISLCLTAADVTPPVLAIATPAAGQITRDSTIAVTGTVTDQTATRVTVNGAETTRTGDGWSATAALAAQGPNTFTVHAVDAAGNAADSTRTIIRDSEAPVIALTTPAAEQTLTRADSVDVAGQVTDRTKVTLTVNGAPTAVATDGHFATRIALAPGANFVLVSATDQAGNGSTVTRQFTRDAVPPVIAWATPANGAVVKTISIDVAGTVTDQSAITLTLNNTPVTATPATGGSTPGAFQTSFALAADGPATLTLLATDAAGNTSTLSRTVTRDATPPVIVVQQPAAGLVTSAEMVHVTGTVTDLTATTLTVSATAVALAADGSFAADVPLIAGSNTIAFVATDAAGNVANAERVVVQDRTPPVVAITAPSDNVITKTVTVTVRGTIADASVVTATLNDTPLVLAADRSYQTTIALSEGANLLTVVATDAAGNSSTATRSLTLDTTPPALAVTAPAEGATTTNEATTVTGTATDASALHVTVKGAEVTLASGGAFSATVALVLGSNSIDVVATDAAGNSTTVSRAVTRETGIDPTLPPNPRTVAPALNRTVATTQAAATAFLYSGSNPVQVGVTPGAISAVQASTLRGRVITTAGAPLPGATVTVLGHPELGATKSRVDGWYDLAANGGGVLTLSFAKDGYLGAQRNVRAPRQDYARVPDVALVKPDTAVTLVQLGPSSDAQVARASTVSDADGIRRATFIFDAGTSATITLPNGTTQAAPALSIRVTEYTVGPNGKAAMPAPLPATSAYTYAAAPTADEAAAVGGTVTFSKPVSAYVENFLGFSPGTKVPLGTYDATAANWQAQPDGRVVKVLSVDGGVAAVDANGDGAADGDSLLTANGFSTAELQRLAATYTPGATLMRTRLFGLYPFDANLPFTALGVDPVVVAAPGCASATRDVVKCDVRNATQAVAVPGTALTLNYTSARSVAAADRTLDIPITGNVMPADLMGMYVHVTVAGQTTEMQWLPAPNVTYHYVWDGNDAYGRPVQGNPSAVVEIGHLFPAEYAFPAEVASSFGLTCSAPPVNGVQGCRTITQNKGAEFTERHSFWRVSTAVTKLGGLDAKAQGLGGFDFNVHHQYDPMGRVLYLGDGSTRIADAVSPVINTVAGSGQSDFASGDGGPATKARFAYQALFGIAVLPDGRILANNSGYLRIVGTDGIINRFAGWAKPATVNGNTIDVTWKADGTVVGEGGLKDSTYLLGPAYPAVGADGTIYVADNGWSGDRIVRITPDGRLTRMAGKRTGAPIRDGIRVTDVALGHTTALTVDPANNIYFVSANAPTRVFRIGADSILHVVAGTGGDALPVEGGLATNQPLRPITAIALGPDGSLYVSTNDIYYYNGFQRRILRITPDGVIRTFVGGGPKPFWETFDRLQVNIGTVINSIVVSSDNVVYFNDGNSILAARQDGRLQWFAGVGAGGFGGDGGPALKATLNGISGLALAPDGTLLIADFWNARIRKVAASMPGFTGGTFIVASDDGSEFYSFDAAGRHLKTIDARTRKAIFEFGYDAFGRTTSLRDGDGRVTTIERDAMGAAVALVASTGQRTALATNADGMLAAITGPDGYPISFAFDSLGALTSVTDQNGQVTTFAYDGGRLVKTTTPDGGISTASEATSALGGTADITSAAGVRSKIAFELLPTGVKRSTTTLAGGQKVEITDSPDGTRTLRDMDGTLTTLVPHADPRYGMQAPLVDATTRLPSGLTMTSRAASAITYDDFDNPLVITDSSIVNGRATVTVYDYATNSSSLTTPAGRKRVTFLDEAGRFVRDSAPDLAVASSTYDSTGRITTFSRGGRTLQLGYNARGHVISRTDPLGRVNRFVYDSADRVIAGVTSTGDTVTYRYDQRGSVTRITPPGKSPHEFTYTPSRLVESYVPPPVGDGRVANQALYDRDGRPAYIIRRGGDTVTTTYDSLGRASTTRTAEGLYQFTYDPVSAALRGVSSPVGSALSFQYDGTLPTVTTWAGLVAGNVATTYDTDFRPATQSVNGTNPVSFSYDPDGLPVGAGALTISRSATTGLAIGTSLGSVQTTATYDEFVAPVAVSANYGGTTLFNARLDRDSVGRIAKRTEAVQGVSTIYGFRYDSAGRLSAVLHDGITAESYEYDANGNRIRATNSSGTVTSTVDAQDRLLTYGTTAYGYTPDGELALKASAGDTTRYRYSSLGALLEVRLPAGRRIEYVTDGQGRRIGKKVDGALVKGWLYDGPLAVAAELGPQNQIVSRFVYGERSNVPAYMVRAGQTYRLITDERGSVRLVVNTGTGEVIQRIDYDAFGRVTANTNPGFQPFGFAGGLYDEQTGLVRFGARDYEPEAGRWTSKDPILFGGHTLNLYQYTGADPLNRIDPTGLDGSLAEQSMTMAAYARVALIAMTAFVVTKAVTETGALAIPLGFRRSDDDNNEVPPPVIPVPTPASPPPPDPDEDPYGLYRACMDACRGSTKRAAFCSLLWRAGQGQYYTSCKNGIKSWKTDEWQRFCANFDRLVY